jgi:hypothetical protein
MAFSLVFVPPYGVHRPAAVPWETEFRAAGEENDDNPAKEVSGGQVFPPAERAAAEPDCLNKEQGQ